MKPALSLLLLNTLFFVLSFSLLMIYVEYNPELANPEIEEVNCYDRYGNIIRGSVCEQVQFDYKINLGVKVVVLLFIAVCICSVVYAVDSFYTGVWF